jgi:hypothetical protein
MGLPIWGSHKRLNCIVEEELQRITGLKHHSSVLIRNHLLPIL